MKPKMPSGLVKPTLETRFHIDTEWWERQSEDLELSIRVLCAELGVMVPKDVDLKEMVDWINPDTGQVVRVDRLYYLFLTRCARQPEYITERTSLIDAIFRALLASGNQPLTLREVEARTGRDAQTMLQTLSGRTVYKGIKPWLTELAAEAPGA